MKKTLLTDNVKINVLGILLSFFILSSTLTTPWILKVLFYVLTLIGLVSFTGFTNFLKDGISDYYPYLIFILVCTLSYVLLPSYNHQISESPQIENIISLFILFVFLIGVNAYYLQIMEILVRVTSVFLLVSLPVHFFYYESSLLSATAFFSHFDYETLSNKNTFGIFLCILLPFAIYRFSQKINIYNYLTVMLFYISIFYIFSRVSLILSILVTIFFLASGRKNFFKASSISLVSILILLFVFQISPSKYNQLKYDSNQQVIEHNYRSVDVKDLPLIKDTKTFSKESARFKYIKLSYQGFLDKPFLGHGITTFRRNNSQVDEKDNIIRNPVAHNDYAQVLYELGLLGIISFLYLFIFNITRIYKNTSLKSDESIIILIQLITFAVSLNSGNYLDHALFWTVMALTLTNRNFTLNNNGIR